MNETIFYRCPICGNLICMIEASGVVPQCCGKPMERLTAETHEGAFEKHLPVITGHGSHVCVHIGEQTHPMTETHAIRWIVLQTDDGLHLRRFRPDDIPDAHFRIAKCEKPECAYAYCNLHGLWATRIAKDSSSRHCRYDSDECK